MSLTLHLNAVTIGLVLTALVWLWFWFRGSVEHGMYDFGPTIFGFAILIGTLAYWSAVLMSKYLR